MPNRKVDVDVVEPGRLRRTFFICFLILQKNVAAKNTTTASPTAATVSVSTCTASTCRVALCVCACACSGCAYYFSTFLPYLFFSPNPSNIMLWFIVNRDCCTASSKLNTLSVWVYFFPVPFHTHAVV